MLGVLLIIAAFVTLGTWLLRTDYQVLFADLAPQDASTMVSELEKLKTPYRLSNGGNTILVPADIVHKTRLKLVGKDLPLRGAVGFELFNDSEVGMTEFAQKVNYQRALQGELTRTILAIEDVLSARVHLVLSEQGLFKKTGSQAKASITIATKSGRTLDAGQIQGIQRLVAAAVPDIKANDVTIVNQQGVALTRHSNPDAETHPSFDGLDDKRAIEAYLNKKIVDVLERTFGAGQAIASVDVTFNRENKKTTTENVLGNNNNGQGVSAGLIVRERHTMRVVNGDTEAANAITAPKTPGLASSEVDYQVGRRVEQVVSASGDVNHINVAVVVRKTLDQAQLDRLKDIVARAVGTVKERGDLVAVYSVDQIGTGFNGDPISTKPAEATEKTEMAPPPAVALERISTDKASLSIALAIFGILAILIIGLLWYFTATKQNVPQELNAQERDKLITQIQAWLANNKQTSHKSDQQLERG